MTKRICAEVNTEAIKKNAAAIKSAAKGKKLIAVIKADAYGHGETAVAKVLEPYCDMYAVATAEEAKNLKAVTDKDILILAMIPDEEKADCIKNKIIMTVSDFSEAEALSLAAKKMNMTARVHAAVDTGMSRIGFKADTAADEIEKIAALPCISVEGIFSHYAASDCRDKSFTELQTKRFEKVCASSGEGKLCHIANSAALTDLDDICGDAVRAGIILYGLYPSDEVNKEKIKLFPALTLKSRVSFVKEIEKGTAVSYGLTFTAKEKMKLATVSAGYADGYPRSLSGKGQVIINGKKYNIVGRICMDQFMVDVTGSNVAVDDEVILIGKSGGEEITADEIATLDGTINYEIMCRIGMRVPRIYI